MKVCRGYGSSWKLPWNIFVETAIGWSNGSFHFHWQWKFHVLPWKYEFFGNFHARKYISTDLHGTKLTPMDVNSISWEISMEPGGNFHGSRSNGSRWILMDVLWKQLEVCDTRGSRWNYTGVYWFSWKLLRNKFVKAAIDGTIESFHFHRQWKRPCISTEASTNFHGRKSNSTNF